MAASARNLDLQPQPLGTAQRAVALRLGIQHPELVGRLAPVSTPYAHAGWHDSNQQGMRATNAALPSR